MLPLVATSGALLSSHPFTSTRAARPTMMATELAEPAPPEGFVWATFDQPAVEVGDSGRSPAASMAVAEPEVEARKVMWEPTPSVMEQTAMKKFQKSVGIEGGYDALWKWSVDN